MSNLSEHDSAFKKILKSLEEEHHRVISQCKQEHAGELSRLHTEYQSQLSSLKAQAVPLTNSPLRTGTEGPKNGAPDVASTTVGAQSLMDVDDDAPDHSALSSPSLRSSLVDRGPPEKKMVSMARSTIISILGHGALTGHGGKTNARSSHTNWNRQSSSGRTSGTNSFGLESLQCHSGLSKSASLLLASATQQSPQMVRDKVMDLVGTADTESFVDKYAMARQWRTRINERQADQTKLQRLVQNTKFDAACSLAIILNTALQGAVTSFRASTLSGEELPVYYRIANICFSCWFLAELILRWGSEGCLAFLITSRNLSWNLFDIVVVATDIVEYVLLISTAGQNKGLSNLSVMRMMRVLRIARALRVLKMVKFCTELRVMVLSVIRSGRALLWALVLMSIIFYIFAIFLMQDVTEHLTKQKSERESLGQQPNFPKESTEGKLIRYFGDFASTFYILFSSVSGGISWCEVSDPLVEVHPSNAIVFCLFIFFTVFAMLNIITGLFVETSFHSVKADHEEVIQEEMNEEDSVMKQLHSIFLEADTGNNGSISQYQFANLLEDEKAYYLLKSCGLQVSEVQGLFSLLDVGHTGQVSIDDFIIGCMRLRGSAREVDLISLLYESRKLRESHNEVAEFVRREFGRLEKFEKRVMEYLHGMPRLHELLIDQQAQLELAVSKVSL